MKKKAELTEFALKNKGRLDKLLGDKSMQEIEQMISPEKELKYEKQVRDGGKKYKEIEL